MTTSSENMASANKPDHGYHEEAMLPGFRFHPTDEELVGFYLRRKVEKKPLSIELIKQIDIYKYDPWDLPSTITSFLFHFLFKFCGLLVVFFFNMYQQFEVNMHAWFK